ncbi:hypothetical protein AJ80_05332 [Polytolypa hystricis UAMH7299]|uniref:Uncharacterized protein n=1 Tax=Polytolypa hystricis (strain UAMH7299) TaxID=1447883 RepID=A0A2B7Y643_POLH7|nr:hypothetical protein AJ80_05332 [Polytolypa hystricis UAMH7299]
MCRQIYNEHACNHAVFVRTKTCGKKQYCPRISRENLPVNHICDRCAAQILVNMRHRGGSNGGSRRQSPGSRGGAASTNATSTTTTTMSSLTAGSRRKR